MAPLPYSEINSNSNFQYMDKVIVAVVTAIFCSLFCVENQEKEPPTGSKGGGNYSTFWDPLEEKGGPGFYPSIKPTSYWRTDECFSFQ